MEILYNIFYELEIGLGWTPGLTLVGGVGTVSMMLYALDIARRRIAEDYPNLDPDQVKGEILKGTEN